VCCVDLSCFGVFIKRKAARCRPRPDAFLDVEEYHGSGRGWLLSARRTVQVGTDRDYYLHLFLLWPYRGEPMVTRSKVS